jgi:hypothetical protein
MQEAIDNLRKSVSESESAFVTFNHRLLYDKILFKNYNLFHKKIVASFVLVQCLREITDMKTKVTFRDIENTGDGSCVSCFATHECKRGVILTCLSKHEPLIRVCDKCQECLEPYLNFLNKLVLGKETFDELEIIKKKIFC